LLLNAKCFIGSESGLIHYAGLLGAPTVAITSAFLPYHLYSLTEIYGVIPGTNCTGCRFLPSKGYVEGVCGQYGCHALSSISPIIIIEEINKCLSGSLPPKLFGRYNSFSYLFSEMHKRVGNKPVNIVETGTARKFENWEGDGYSTLAFGWWAKKTGSRFYSVDIDAKSIETSKSIGDLYKNNINWVLSDSATFLKQFNNTIDLLYLDSFDSYPGQESEAQNHQLQEIKNAIPKINKNGLILIDDIGDDLMGGKGELSIPFLKQEGWKIINHDKSNRQVLFSM